MSYFHEIFVRAKTSDDRWASVNAADLDERSFRLLILDALGNAGAFAAVVRDGSLNLRTPLTKAQAEGDEPLSSASTLPKEQ